MKRKINIIAVALMLAISSFIGIGKVRGEDIWSDSEVTPGGQVIPGDFYGCKNSSICTYASENNPATYIVIEVYDVRKNSYTYYYDFGTRKRTQYANGNSSSRHTGNSPYANVIYDIDMKEVLGLERPYDDTYGGVTPEVHNKEKWGNVLCDNAKETGCKEGLFSSFDINDSINKTKWTTWLYYSRPGAPYQNYSNVDDALRQATQDLKQYGNLFVVRFSGGMVMWENKSDAKYVAIDRFFNETQNINDTFGVTYNQFVDGKDFKELKTADPVGVNGIGISTHVGSSYLFGLCHNQDIRPWCYNAIVNTAYFSDGGKISYIPEDPCETLCKKSEVKNGWKYTDLPNGMTTEEACVSCCENGKINLNLGSCKYKPNECIYTPPTPIGEQPSDNQLTCNNTTTISSKTLTGDVIENQCGGVPIYASVNGTINVDDLRTFYDGTLAKLLVAGKGFNWNLLFSGIIQIQRSIDKTGYLNSYNIYTTCLKNKIDAGIATDTEKAEFERYTRCYNDLYNYNENNLQGETLKVSELLTATDKQMNINGYAPQIANQYDAIYKNSGDPFNTHTVDVNQDFVYTYTEFFIPITVQNDTKGDLIAKVNSNSSVFQLQNNEVKCPIIVSSYVKCQDDDKCLDDDDGDNDDDDDNPCEPNDPDCPFFTCDDPKGCTTGLNLIYRPISLKDPFPNRIEGYNWKGYTDLITNNRNVSDNEVYNQEPMYVITLTPADIKEIRQYNKTHSYNDFDLICDANGLYCRSKFITTYRNLFESGTCGLDGNWYACYTQNQEDIVEAILSPMKYKKEGE